jgi:hypothetical protein
VLGHFFLHLGDFLVHEEILLFELILRHALSDFHLVQIKRLDYSAQIVCPLYFCALAERVT